MVANTAASIPTSDHCPRVNARSRGLPTARRTAAATHWRTATTPTGPITGKASAPNAAPVWLLSAPLSISATPEVVAGRWRRAVSMRPAWAAPVHSQNASQRKSIR